MGTPRVTGPLTTSFRGLWVSGLLSPGNGGRAEGRRPQNRPSERRGRLGPRAGIPKRKRPNCHEKRYSRTSVGIAQKEVAPKTSVCEFEGTQGPWRRGATGCCRLSRQLLARHGWTIACVGLFVSFVALLDKPVEDTSIVLVHPKALAAAVWDSIISTFCAIVPAGTA